MQFIEDYINKQPLHKQHQLRYYLTRYNPKRFAMVLGGALVFWLLGLFLLPAFIEKDAIIAHLQQQIQAEFGLELQVENVDLSVFPPTLYVQNIKLVDTAIDDNKQASQHVMLQVPSAVVSLGYSALWGNNTPHEVVLEAPVLTTSVPDSVWHGAQWRTQYIALQLPLLSITNGSWHVDESTVVEQINGAVTASNQLGVDISAQSDSKSITLLLTSDVSASSDASTAQALPLQMRLHYGDDTIAFDGTLDDQASRLDGTMQVTTRDGVFFANASGHAELAAMLKPEEAPQHLLQLSGSLMLSKEKVVAKDIALASVDDNGALLESGVYTRGTLMLDYAFADQQPARFVARGSFDHLVLPQLQLPQLQLPQAGGVDTGVSISNDALNGAIRKLLPDGMHADIIMQADNVHYAQALLKDVALKMQMDNGILNIDRFSANGADNMKIVGKGVLYVWDRPQPAFTMVLNGHGQEAATVFSSLGVPHWAERVNARGAFRLKSSLYATSDMLKITDFQFVAPPLAVTMNAQFTRRVAGEQSSETEKNTLTIATRGQDVGLVLPLLNPLTSSSITDTLNQTRTAYTMYFPWLATMSEVPLHVQYSAYDASASNVDSVVSGSVQMVMDAVFMRNALQVKKLNVEVDSEGKGKHIMGASLTFKQPVGERPQMGLNLSVNQLDGSVLHNYLFPQTSDEAMPDEKINNKKISIWSDSRLFDHTVFESVDGVFSVSVDALNGVNTPLSNVMLNMESDASSVRVTQFNANLPQGAVKSNAAINYDRTAPAWTASFSFTNAAIEQMQSTLLGSKGLRGSINLVASLNGTGRSPVEWARSVGGVVNFAATAVEMDGMDLQAIANYLPKFPDNGVMQRYVQHLTQSGATAFDLINAKLEINKGLLKVVDFTATHPLVSVKALGDVVVESLRFELRMHAMLYVPKVNKHPVLGIFIRGTPPEWGKTLDTSEIEAYINQHVLQ